MKLKIYVKNSFGLIYIVQENDKLFSTAMPTIL